VKIAAAEQPLVQAASTITEAEPAAEETSAEIIEAPKRKASPTPLIIEANDDLPRPTIWQPIVAVIALAAVAGGVIYSQKHHNAAPVLVSQTAPATATQSAETTQPDADVASSPVLVPEKTAGASVVTGIRHWSSSDSSTVAIDLQDQVQYEAHRLSGPDRIYFDLHETNLAPGVIKNMEVGDPLLVRVRAAQPVEGITRVVLETKGATNFSVSLEQNPYRLVVEVRSANAKPQPHARVELFAPQTETASAAPTQSPTVAAIAPTPPPHLAPFAPKFRIALDAGHGGWDLGTVGKHGLLEKDLVLDVVQRLGKLVESRLGAQVIYTRADDSYVPLERRTEIANLAHADLFLSIHANYSDYPSARGVETYYTNTYSSLKARMPGDGATSADVQTVRWTDVNILDKVRESRRFATNIQQSLYGGLTKSTPIPNRGVKEAGYVVLTGATMPAVLTEVSFVSSPTDEDNLQRAAYRQQIAESLYKGIAQYAQATHKVTVASAAASAGSIAPPRSLARVRASTASRASRRSSSAVGSSITAKCGATPASSGKRDSSDWQNAWMVWILSPPGTSSTVAKSWRARTRSRGSAARPVSSRRSSSSAPSLHVAQTPRRPTTRVIISLAAAFVKVRQSTRLGGVPCSSRLSTRSVSTLVLPVPADALTQTLWRGSAACCCLSVACAIAAGAFIRRPRRPTIP